MLKPAYVRKLYSASLRRHALDSSKWLALFLGALLIYSTGLQVGYDRALVSITPLERVDLKCRYGVQAQFLRNIDLLDRELQEYYPMLAYYPQGLSEVDNRRQADLHAQRKLYTERLLALQENCLTAISAENSGAVTRSGP